LVIKAITIPNAKILEGVVFYVINVKGSFNAWSVAKRFSQFEDLQTILQDMKGFPASLELPPKRVKLFTSHVSAQFIEERRCLLENYMKKLLVVGDIAKAEAFLNFLQTDKHIANEEKLDTASTTTKAAVPADDVEITGVSIPATRTMSDHILYQIDVVNANKRKTFSKWTVLKRFGQFYEMDTQVRTAFVENTGVLASMPPQPQRRAKLFNDHMDSAFVEQRRALLENYLQKMLAVAEVVRNKDFLLFLGVNV